MKYHGCGRHILNQLDFRKIFTALILSGFLSGIIYGNVIAKEYILSLGIFDEYLLNQYSRLNVNIEEYIWYIIRIRITPVIFLLLAGCTKYRKIIISLFIVWTGFSFGLILTAAIIRLQAKGIIVCLISILPHFICYIGGYLMLLIYYISYPNSRWTGAKTISFILFWLLGVVSECYINPGLIELVFTRL